MNMHLHLFFFVIGRGSRDSVNRIQHQEVSNAVWIYICISLVYFMHAKYSLGGVNKSNHQSWHFKIPVAKTVIPLLWSETG